jgi:hypothetical protein
MSKQMVKMSGTDSLEATQTIVTLCLAQDEDLEAEVDEMWSFVQLQGQQRCLRLVYPSR